MLWLAEMPWDSCNMGGIHYILFEGTEEDAKRILPDYSREPDGTHPIFSQSVKMYSVEFFEKNCSVNLLTPKPSEELIKEFPVVEWVEEPVEKSYCFYDGDGSMFGRTAETVD